MKIEMLETEKGSQFGTDVEVYKKGEEYDIIDSLAKVFIDIKSAKEITGREIIKKDVDVEDDEDPDVKNPPDIFTLEQLEDMQVERDLKPLAEKYGIEGYDDMTKKFLIPAIEKAQKMVLNPDNKALDGPPENKNAFKRGENTEK